MCIRDRCYAALQRILRMLSTCPSCEVPYQVGLNACPSCAYDTEYQTVILTRLYRNKAVRELIHSTESGQRLYRNRPTLREQFTRGG
eukprot:10541605-Alexandrium_andersonii.AAC.1